MLFLNPVQMHAAGTILEANFICVLWYILLSLNICQMFGLQHKQLSKNVLFYILTASNKKNHFLELLHLQVILINPSLFNMSFSSSLVKCTHRACICWANTAFHYCCSVIRTVRLPCAFPVNMWTVSVCVCVCQSFAFWQANICQMFASSSIYLANTWFHIFEGSKYKKHFLKLFHMGVTIS